VFGELANYRRRIHIDDADDPVPRLQRHCDQCPDVLSDYDAALPKRIVKGGVPHENRDAAVENANRYGRTDAEAVTLVCLNDQFAAFEGHQSPAIALDCLN